MEHTATATLSFYNPQFSIILNVKEFVFLFRGEKLYVTMDKRSKKGCGKCFCWGICLAILVAAVVIGILAASKYSLNVIFTILIYLSFFFSIFNLL